MRVSISIQFDVEPVNDEDGDLSKNQAEGAADWAAWNYLALCTEVTQGTIAEEVEVHAEGFGPCTVRLVEP